MSDKHTGKDALAQGEMIENASHPTVLHNETDNYDPDTKGNNLDVHNMDMTDRYTALKLAHEADPGPPLASGRMMMFFFYIFVCCMCSGDNGEFGSRKLQEFLPYHRLPLGQTGH
jgi:hypothetical protein